jgi:multidrug resistance efflux pump
MLNLSENTVDKKDLEKKRLYSIGLINMPVKVKIVRRWLIGIFIFLAVCLFLPWQQNVSGYGRTTALKPQERPQTLPSLIPGRIAKWYVQEGQFVEEGDTIIVITEVKEKFLDTNLLNRMALQIKAKEDNIAAKQNKILALNNQIEFLERSLEFSLQKARNKLIQATLKVSSDSAKMVATKIDSANTYDQYRRNKLLYDSSLTTQTKLQERQSKYQLASAKAVEAEMDYNKSVNELINARIQLNSLEAEYLEKISKAESTIAETQANVFESQEKLAKLNIEYSNLSIRNGFYTIRAPQTGYVVKALKAGIGEAIKEGENVVSIMPKAPQLAVEMYIRPLDLPIVHEGSKVRVQFDGWPALVFSGWPDVSVGTFGGIVQNIDRVSSSNSKFRLLIVPDPSDEPWPKQIQMGSGTYCWAMLNNVPVWYEIWRQFNGFPPDFPEGAQTETEKRGQKYLKPKKK